jgi:hypothetical protein
MKGKNIFQNIFGFIFYLFQTQYYQTIKKCIYLLIIYIFFKNIIVAILFYECIIKNNILYFKKYLLRSLLFITYMI